MTASETGNPTGDIALRDLLSSLTALQALSMVMTDSRDEHEILDLAVAAVPSLSRHCRTEAVWLDGGWRSVRGLRGGVRPCAGLEAQLARLGVRDDGRGRAEIKRGSGLVGLADRVGTLGGRLSLHSPPGAGTNLQIELPLDESSRTGDKQQ
jgi:hypothetical protein